MISIYEVRGREAGREEGRAEGKRDTLLKQLRLKFGSLPERTEANLFAITSEVELDALAERVLTANSLHDMQLETE